MASKKKRKAKIQAKSKSLTKTSPSSGKKFNNTVILLGLSGVVIIAGIWLTTGGSGNQDNYDDLNLPSYAYTNAVTLKAYGYTILNPEVVEKIPCYCGCGGIGHKSLKNCYISDDGVYSSHASNCDVCVGEVIRIKSLYESGLYISEIKEIIDREYGRYGPDNGGVPITQDFNIDTKNLNEAAVLQQVESINYSNLELDPGFRSLKDGLSLTPSGVVWAQFVNMKLASGTPLEDFASDRVRPPGFYGVPLVGMYSADYNQNSWIELHDIGYEDLNIRPVSQSGMSNIAVTRPFIFGHTPNVQKTRQLMDDPSSMESAYTDYQAILDGIDGLNAAVSYVALAPNPYSDMYYSELNDAGNGLVQRILIYHLVPGEESLTSQYETRAADSLARGFTRYDVNQKGDILVVTMGGTLENVLHEAM